MDFILKYWIEFLFTLLTTGVIYVFKQYLGLKQGMISLLRNEIIRVCEKCTNDGYCVNYMKENVKEMYEAYSKLGGNGMVTIAVQALYKLPSSKYGEKR